jgi:hypothetical protein
MGHPETTIDTVRGLRFHRIAVKPDRVVTGASIIIKFSETPLPSQSFTSGGSTSGRHPFFGISKFGTIAVDMLGVQTPL